MDGDGAGARDGDVDGGAGGQLLRSACGPLLQHDNKNNPLITQNHPFVCTSLTMKNLSQGETRGDIWRHTLCGAYTWSYG